MRFFLLFLLVFSGIAFGKNRCSNWNLSLSEMQHCETQARNAGYAEAFAEMMATKRNNYTANEVKMFCTSKLDFNLATEQIDKRFENFFLQECAKKFGY